MTVTVTDVQAPGSSRDLLLLDIALESWLRMLVERQDKRNLSGDDLVELMGLVLGNAALAGTSAELELVAAQWEAVRACPDRCVGVLGGGARAGGLV
jgi:alpha-glucan,water dikinase